ncbi:MAG: glycosyltransferase family 4 protein [Thiobacillus sp.]|nr:glycosyltransferase family 4 protein [Thiobacillus sp.]
MLTPPRLLVITELFLPTKGGTAVWFDAAYRRLGGKDIHIVTADVPGSKAVDHDHPNSIHRVSLKRHAWLRPESLAMYSRLLLKGLAVALRHRISAVHAGRVLPEGLVGWAIARLTRTPIVIYAHGEEIMTWRQAGKFKAMRFAYRHADRVIANSDFTRAELLKLGVQSDRLSLIFPGVDIDRFKPDLAADHLRASLGLRADQKLILSVGRLSRRKGFDQVIQALPKLAEENIDAHYALIGIGEDFDYLTDLARTLGVVDRVHMLGHVSADDLPLWYNACDVFAMPNREIDGDTEGFGMVFLEAAACGKPCIAGDAGGTGSAVEDGVTGYRVDGNDLGQIASSFVALLRDKALCHTFGQAGHARAVNDFSWDAVTRKTRALIQSH